MSNNANGMTANPQYYQESLKYIENFYNKYAVEMQKQYDNQIECPGANCSEMEGFQNDNGTSIQQISYYDTLSRDEDYQDEIREEIINA